MTLGVDFFWILVDFSSLVGFKMWRQIIVLQVSEGYRRVEEVGAVHFHQVASKSGFMEPSYGLKTVLS